MAKYSGSGMDLEDPIVISGVGNHIEAVGAEYQFLEARFGRRGVMWTLESQSLLQHEGRMIDRMDIRLKSGEDVILYFDITKYFGQY